MTKEQKRLAAMGIARGFQKIRLDSDSKELLLDMLKKNDITNEVMESIEKDIPNTSLTVTNIQIFPLKEPIGKTKAMVRVQLNDELQLTGLRIVDGANGLFLAYPNDPGYKGEDFRSIFYPLTRDLRDHIESEVLIKYKKMMEE